METPENQLDDINEWQLVEAVLFSSNHSLSVPQIKKITGLKETGKITEIITELNEFYRDNNRSFAIQKVAGGYQLRSLAKFKKWIRKGRIVKPIQLSPSVMETLAIVAYRQPVTRAEVEDIRSVDATYSLKSLLDRKLIKIAGRKEIPGRPILYATSGFFLEVFGFNTLQDLPRPEEFDILPGQELEIEVNQAEE